MISTERTSRLEALERRLAHIEKRCCPGGPQSPGKQDRAPGGHYSGPGDVLRYFQNQQAPPASPLPSEPGWRNPGWGPGGGGNGTPVPARQINMTQGGGAYSSRAAAEAALS